MTPRDDRTARRSAGAAAAAALLSCLVVVGCDSAPNSVGPSGPPSRPAGSAFDSTGATSAPPASSPASSPAAECVVRTVDHLSSEQRAGQLIGVALESGGSYRALDRVIARSHAGNVVLLGGWTRRSRVRETTSHLQRQATPANTGAVGMLVAADQEGGFVRQLRVPGFAQLPTALTQGRQSSSTRVSYGRTIGRELKSVGVNLDLAPVADTVPASLGKGNGPIGAWDRQYGSDYPTVGDAVTDVVHGLRSAGVQATVKHFPGIGRIRNNTDFFSTGITDTRTTADDRYLQPFERGIKAGAGLVMTSTATYTRIDPDNPASFSAKVIGGILRSRLHFAGVVISDDLHAASVRALPANERVLRFLDAGGDIALTGSAAEVQAMVGAITRRAETSTAFRSRVRESTLRVVALKAGLGLVPGCKP